MNNDLISREAAIDALHTLSMYYGSYAEKALKEGGEKLKRLPAVDAEPVRHGKWKEPYPNDIWDCWQCSNCGYTTDRQSNYCPNCGAKMDEED